MRPTFRRLDTERASVLAEAELTAEAARRHAARKAEPDYDAVDRWTAVSAIGSGIEKTYTGIERTMTIIAAQIDGEVPRDPAWHRTLLEQMAESLPGVRPALLTPATAELLDRLRAFRHRERQTYGSDLHEDRVLELVPTALGGATAFAADLTRLIAHLSEAGED